MAATSLSYKYKTANILVKLIIINVAAFLLVYLGSFILNMSPQYFTRWFVLSDDFDTLLFRPWTLITYGFLHFGFLHILFNMLWLYWFGQFVLNLFTGKRLLTVYLLGALFGGLLFVVAYNLFPAFEQSRGFLIGASGAVTAIMVFIATYTPNTEVRIFTFTIKLWHIALFLFLLDLVRIPSSGNAGGLMAHVGGAIFGYIYAIQLAKGHDIGLWFENIMDWVANLFKPRSKKPFKTVHRTKRNTTATAKPNKDKSAHQKKVDGILDKIGKSGYESLTKAEKDFLFKAGKDD
ncbi:rhomboid family intramembrane serine protease [Aequorivita sp. F47161]|uniref:Rhomboid family intramembrane serine protease n=1 Tax=Aequorivita vitellina TaxID=2874475 RepID=A0A9X1U8X8_9FLAO|nr:rhomboid family intramembrane serine protease [Aequorivita vitellina]MCG2417906.1 rhomboid family intramembrane serine protease [Aequorivita vitellina]MCZ4320152.1 rhomboid family intramembrane serine protease [Aequorivita viscosa]